MLKDLQAKFGNNYATLKDNILRVQCYSLPVSVIILDGDFVKLFNTKNTMEFPIDTNINSIYQVICLMMRDN